MPVNDKMLRLELKAVMGLQLVKSHLAEAVSVEEESLLMGQSSYSTAKPTASQPCLRLQYPSDTGIADVRDTIGIQRRWAWVTEPPWISAHLLIV